MSSGPAKIFIKVETTSEQQENIKNSRKTFKVLQKSAGTTTTDKENLIGRVPAYIAKKDLVKSLSQDNEVKRKIVQTQSSSSQTSPDKKLITEEDLTSEAGPSEYYWEVLAEKRRVALEESLVENQELYERLSSMEDELHTSKALLEESKNLVEVLTEMLQEGEEDETEKSLEHAEEAKEEEKADEEKENDV